MLTPIEKAALGLMIFVLMLGMGSTLSWSDFRSAIEKPKGILIGFLSQFVLMPLIAVGLARVLELDNIVALSLILIGSTPGGTTSNLFTYFSRGDVALSISMTVASTFAAVLMMPIILLLFAANYTSAEFAVPNKNIVSTLILILLPVSIGMIVRKKNGSVANKLEKIGSAIGIVVILFLIGEFLFRRFDILKSATLNIYAAAILLGLCGFILGYIFSKIVGLSERQSRTVSLETGIQNTPVTMAIIIASFPANEQAAYLLLPMLYALFIVIDSTIVTCFFRFVFKKDTR